VTKIMVSKHPAWASIRADADYRTVRDAASQAPNEYHMYAPRPAVCPPAEDPPFTCAWPEAVNNVRERDEVSTRQRGGGKFSGGLFNPTTFQHGDGTMFHPGTSARLRNGAVVRGTLPRPTTSLVTQAKYQYGKGEPGRVDDESVLQTKLATVRRGAQRPSTALVGASTYGLGRTPGSIGEPTAVRARHKYNMALAPLDNDNRPISDPLVYEDFARGGLFTRQGPDEVVMF
jgi:hypothetical protein